MNERRPRGVSDILIAVVDGLNGLPEAINASFRQTQMQKCIVHLLRHSLSFASWKDRRELAAARQPVYPAVTSEAAREALENCAAGPWGRKYPAVAPAWRRQWEQVIPFFAYPAVVRRIIDTTNATESLHSKRRTVVCSRGHSPNDEAATKLRVLVKREVSREGKMPQRECAAAKTQFAVMLGERFIAA
jgi:putative transposase